MSKEKTKAELEKELSQLKEAYRLRVIERDHASEVQDALENENKRLAGIISEALSEKRKATPADLAEIQSGEQVSSELRKANADMQKEIDRLKEAYDGAARRNDELQNEVNKLRQRWTDEFNPEDELLGRKVLEWQDINVVLAKHNVENSMVLDAELDMLKEYRKVLDKHGIMGSPHLDESLGWLERFQRMLRDWHFQTIDEFSAYVNGLYNYKIICGQNLISSTDELKKSFDELKELRLSQKDKPLGRKVPEWQEIDCALKKHSVLGPNDLDNRLDMLSKYQKAAYDLQKSEGFKWLSDYVRGGTHG